MPVKEADCTLSHPISSVANGLIAPLTDSFRCKTHLFDAHLPLFCCLPEDCTLKKADCTFIVLLSITLHLLHPCSLIYELDNPLAMGEHGWDSQRWAGNKHKYNQCSSV